MLLILLLSFAVLLIIGIPVAAAMGISSVLSLLIGSDIPLVLIPQKMATSLDSFSLMAVPLFILAGQLMNTGGITKRIIAFSKALVGHIRGGLSHVNVVASMIFAGVSGSSTADAAGIGSVLIPSMINEGYEEDWAITITAASSTIGPIIPPSIIMVIYGSITQLSIGRLFLAGVIPGIAVGVILMVIGYILAVVRKHEKAARASFKTLMTTFKSALPALLAPLIILFGITTGIFTATEAGVIVSLYAMILGFVYKELTLKKLYEIFIVVAKNTAVVLFILACASSFGWILAREQLPTVLMNFLLSITGNPTVLLLLVVVLMLIIGLFVEGLAAMIIFVPIIVPIVQSFGFHPLHIALIIIMSIMIGAITPPVAVLLYVSCSAAHLPLKKSGSLIWVFVLGMLIVLLLMVFIPSLVTAIPDWLLPEG